MLAIFYLDIPGGGIFYICLKNKKVMKKFSCFVMMFALALVSAVSCQDKIEPDVYDGSDESSIATKEQFAVILSRAVYENEDLRDFLKEEALKLYDNDQDVFYPLLKNKMINGSDSFRDILARYDEDGQLARIERDHPLLTILVPDWSWISTECFSAENWDTEDPEVAVGYEDNSDSHIVYIDGRKAYELQSGEFPAFPVLIVKDNERIRVVSEPTKGGEGTYEFVDEAFDGSKNALTKATWYDQTWDYNTDGSSDFVDESLLDDLVIGAWNEFGDGWNNAMHRDYIYYDMTKTKTSDGKLNSFIREKILRFKISPKDAFTMIDPGKDPQFNSEITIWKKANELKGNDIQNILWSDGAFEINFTFFWGEDLPDEMGYFTKSFSVRPYDIWELTSSSVKKSLRPFEGFQYRYVYYNDADNLVAKWYYPTDDVYLPLWDISTQSSDIWFRVSEFDDETQIQETITKSYKYTNNFSVKGDGEASGSLGEVSLKGSLGLDYGYADEHSGVSSITYTWDHSSNNLGDCDYSFDMPIIRSNRYLFGNKYGYDVLSVSTGRATVTIAPYDIRK